MPGGLSRCGWRSDRVCLRDALTIRTVSFFLATHVTERPVPPGRAGARYPRPSADDRKFGGRTCDGAIARRCAIEPQTSNH